MPLPEKMSGLGGLPQLLLPVWKPERVFNLAAMEVTINDEEVTDGPKTGRSYISAVTTQLWVADTPDQDYYCVASTILPARKYRAFSFCGYINGYGFEEVVRIPATAIVVAVTNALWSNVFTPSGPGYADSEAKPQLDVKIHGTFL